MQKKFYLILHLLALRTLEGIQTDTKQLISKNDIFKF